MVFDPARLAIPGVLGLKPYEGGKPIEELAREYGIRDAIKLASNENPLGPSPRALEAMQAHRSELARYPDGNGLALKAALAAKLGVHKTQITLGNGSNEILELAARCFVNAGQQIMYSQHSFAVYPLVTQAIGAEAVVVPARAWGHDLEAMAAAVTPNTRLVFIANPNNPTGTWFTGETLLRFLAALPQGLVVVLDEAYYEYVEQAEYPDSLKLLAQHPNLIITRTFSKAYGLAGLRIGYGISSAAIADLLNRLRQPFNNNAQALLAAEAALADSAHLSASVALNSAGMAQYLAAVETLGLQAIPSVGNFLSIDLGREAAPVYEAMLRQGVIVRPIANYGMPRHLRITIGTEAENQRCLQALARALETVSV